MADSENSRSLSANTRLNILSYTTDFLARTEHRVGDDPNADSTLGTWWAWNEAHREFTILCHLQQRLEVQLTETIGFPVIKIDVAGKDDPVAVQSEAEIEYWLKGDDLAEARDRAKDALSAQLSRWTKGCSVTGYTQAREAESVAADRECALAADLWDMRAHSIEGVIAKLHVVLTMGIASPDCDEFPWPPLRSVLTDLLAMIKTETPSLRAIALLGPQR